LGELVKAMGGTQPAEAATPLPEHTLGLDPLMDAPEPAAAPVPPEPRPVPVTRTALEDAEAAAMRAIEGSWTPSRRSGQSPVPHPEEIGLPGQADDAVETARSAVAAAAAAAAAAIAEVQERPQGEAGEVGELRFEPRTPAPAPTTFLEDADAPAADAAATGVETANGAVHRGFGRPEALPAPREGNPDDLKQIKGITPSLEASLHGLGIFHFDQIAAWDQKAVVWIEQHLSMHGRIGRERWREQASDLGSGRGHKLRPVRR
jgi:predicted flap endonuclease-1-like 5' DNA nuclease